MPHGKHHKDAQSHKASAKVTKINDVNKNNTPLDTYY